MRQAPPVGVTCSGGGAWRWAQAALAGLAAAAFITWVLLWLGLGPAPAALAACVGAAVAAGAMAAWQAPKPASLRWDGAQWSVDGDAGEVVTMLDLGGWMLLRWRAPAAARWLALSAAEAGGAWHGLRAALYSSAAPPSSAAAGPRPSQRQAD